MITKILVLEPEHYSSEAIGVYSQWGKVEAYVPAKGFEYYSDIKYLVCRLGYNLDKQFLSHFPQLQLILSPTTGLNHIDVEFCESRGIEILSLKGDVPFLERITATAELTFGLLLSLIRRIPASHADVVIAGHWDRNKFCGRELAALNLGVVGFGRLGKKMATFAQAFGMKVYAYDPHLEERVFVDSNVESLSLAQLFSSCDVVSLHASYNESNKQFIDKKYLFSMKQGSYLINTARGELVNEVDLLEALHQKILGGAALDVIGAENKIENWSLHPLVRYAKRHDNLIITPHLGGCTRDSMTKTEIYMAEKLSKKLQQETDEIH